MVCLNTYTNNNIDILEHKRGFQIKSKTISHSKSFACDVAMLQEAEMHKLKQRWVGQVFSAPGSGAARGVSFLIAKQNFFRINKTNS